MKTPLSLFEFIELTNISPTDTLNLAELHFTGAVSYAFPELTLEPGEQIYIVGELQEFLHRYNTVPVEKIAGRFDGRLSNSDETLSLRNGLDLIHTLTYTDEWPWPICADGQGYSLVLKFPTTAPDHSLPQSWECSAHFGGELSGNAIHLDYTKWIDYHLDEDTISSLGNPLDDADLDGTPNQLEFAFGTHPSRPDSRQPKVAVQEDNGSRYPFLEFQLPSQDLSLDYTVEKSDSLEGTWTPVPEALINTISTIWNPDNTRTRTYQIMEEVNDTTRRFYRIKVSDQ